MGRIKTKLVKRVTHKLIEEHGDEFTEDFDKNKVLVEKFTDVQSNKLRNIVSGYVTRKVKTRDVI